MSYIKAAYPNSIDMAHARRFLYPIDIPSAATLLDTMYPGWHTKIDVVALDMKLGFGCILAMVYGSYREGLTHFVHPGGSKIYMSDVKSDCVFGANASKADWVNEVHKRVKQQETATLDPDLYIQPKADIPKEIVAEDVMYLLKKGYKVSLDLRQNKIILDLP